tara:strand:+ start:5296 stop:6063 length:768 start_codon:yes stop_codon:yes gene_type:complete
MTIPNIQVNSTHVNSIGIYSADIPEWLTTTPNQTVPNVPPTTVIIGNPIIDMPGCVETHEFSDRNNEIIKDDPDNLLVFCDAEYPSYDAMDYEPDQLQMQLEAAPPPIVQPPPEVDPPEVPPTGDLATDVPCPGPGNLRIGDLTQSGDERVIGHELSQDGKICVTLYEPTTPAEKFLPSVNQATTTVAIAVLATAGAAATPLLLRLIKPVIKKLTTAVQKKLGSHREISKSEIAANRYRQSKGLPPLKLPKKKKT